MVETIPYLQNLQPPFLRHGYVFPSHVQTTGIGRSEQRFHHLPTRVWFWLGTTLALWHLKCLTSEHSFSHEKLGSGTQTALMLLDRTRVWVSKCTQFTRVTTVWHSHVDLNEPKVAHWKEAMANLLHMQRTILRKELLMSVLLYRRAFIIKMTLPIYSN